MLGGRYHLVEPLARGGMAAVWIADDPVLSRRVAVKILRDDLAADEGTRARFRHEAISAARLNHPNVVATYDTGDDGGTAYIVMELIDGPTVRQLLREQGRLPIREAIRIGVQVADALEAAHRAGIVHRDVKPPNVLVPPAGPVKVADFGIAKATGADDLTRTGTVMGTARYLAPEQVNGKPTDARTDVYGLGLLLYEMLCGRPPFGGATDVATAMARLTMSAPSIRAQRSNVPQSLDDVVHRCLARDPARRFASAGDARAALAAVRPDPRPALRSGTEPAPRPTPRPPRAVPTPRSGTKSAARRRSGVTWVWVVIVFLLAIAIAVTAFLVLRDDERGTSSTSPAPRSGTEPAPRSATEPAWHVDITVTITGAKLA
ncbi:MAG: protein kinase [Acidimicrobiia bacterium]